MTNSNPWTTIVMSDRDRHAMQSMTAIVIAMVRATVMSDSDRHARSCMTAIVIALVRARVILTRACKQSDSDRCCFCFLLYFPRTHQLLLQICFAAKCKRKTETHALSICRLLKPVSLLPPSSEPAYSYKQ